MQLPDDEYTDAQGIRWLLVDRQLVERVLITKGKRNGKNYEDRIAYQHVISTRIRAPSPDPDAVQRTEADNG